MFKPNILVAMITILLAGASALSAQEITAFEIVNNESVGLTVAPIEKYGVAVADIDRNGYPDIFCIRWASPGYSRIYINQGGIFQDITDQSPLEQIEAEGQENYTRGALWVDYDNDGDRDLSISTEKGLHFLRNDNNTFTEISEQVGFVGQIPPGFIISWKFSLGSWADYDLDGDLDCVVGQQNNENVYLFRNDGDVFTNINGVGLDSVVEASSVHRLAWTDIDLDGDPDLFASYNFFRNDNGYFTEITEELGFSELGDVNRRRFFDYDLDGDLDFFKVVKEPTDAAANEMWENREGVFVNVTDDVGLTTLPKNDYRGMCIGDFDNDGDEDIFLQLNIDPSLDILLVNDLFEDGSRAFADVAEFVGITKTGDRKGSAFLDYDMDGLLDIYLPSAEHNHILYHNLGGNEANWVGFILEGTLSNRDAVGSLVTLHTAEKKQIRYTKCGNGFLSQDNPFVHFGIGFDTNIDSVVIRWPLGYEQVLTDVAINKYHDIKEPDYTSVDSKNVESKKPAVYYLAQNYPNPFNPSTKINYTISETNHINLTVFDMNGREIITLFDCKQTSGQHSVVWKGRDSKNNLVSSGVYLYQLKSDNFVESRKMVFIQ